MGGKGREKHINVTSFFVINTNNVKSLDLMGENTFVKFFTTVHVHPAMGLLWALLKFLKDMSQKGWQPQG